MVMKQKAALAAGAIGGAAVAFVLGRRRAQRTAARPVGGTPSPERDLQARLAEAREARADESEFEAAGMAGETIVAEEPTREPPPADEFEAMRRRVHEEARAAAEEMRRKPESPD
jgi:hypothetical protein